MTLPVIISPASPRTLLVEPAQPFPRQVVQAGHVLLHRCLVNAVQDSLSIQQSKRLEQRGLGMIQRAALSLSIVTHQNIGFEPKFTVKG